MKLIGWWLDYYDEMGFVAIVQAALASVSVVAGVVVSLLYGWLWRGFLAALIPLWVMIFFNLAMSFYYLSPAYIYRRIDRAKKDARR